MKTILLVLGLLCLVGSGFGQSTKSIKPFSIDDLLPNLSLGKLVFYKDTTAHLYDFKGKLILFDFWFTGCPVCIEMFPRVDSLQKRYGKHLQVIMVTRNPKEKVLPFIRKYERQHHIKWTLPIVVGDTALHKYFPHHAEPNYVWIAPERRFVAETSSFFLWNDVMKAYLQHIPYEIINSGYSIDSLYKN